MATWVKITTESGETVYVNLDQVARIDRRSGFIYTTIRFGDSRLDAAVTETPEEVFSAPETHVAVILCPPAYAPAARQHYA